MKIFIDTADRREIQEACSWGVVDGLTTNPTLLRKAMARETGNVDIAHYIEQVCRIVPGPVSLEVIGVAKAAMVEEGRKLFERFNPIRHNVVIKIPANTSADETGRDFEGTQAIAALSSRGIPVNATLVMTPEQAILCAKAGARYVSPFMGRVDDFEAKRADSPSGGAPSAGNRLVSGIAQILRAYEFPCEIIAASIRNVGHVRAALLSGAHIATIPFGVLHEMISHPKTADGIRRFTEDVIPEYSSLFTSLPKPT